ncbi:trypsin-like serine protease [Dyadobacter pollutisoli]|uniref:Trypsin-like serine protease n=1 Tax=Dyadobacter pollutisoli TaxID=2910158 RepID=A0A9E8NE01_9BACT|nr:trypsin-like serine protease [Dyadobacter pollutisoli]WAC12791.1 trypsin-like serine protease [Dyadobacter pollutisoli]
MKEEWFTNSYRNWFYKFGSIFIVLIVTYAVLHAFRIYEGEEIVNFTDQEKASITTLVDNYISSDSTNPDKKNIPEKLRDNIVTNLEKFVTARYKLDSSSKSDLKQFLVQFANSGFAPSLLIEFKIRVHSYFWLTEDGVFLEIIFWSLFGVLCSLFFYVSESMAKNEFKTNQEYIHAAKLFYAPITTLVVYFSINALVSNGEVNLNNLKHGLIILSYVLGFFSGRTIDLLSRIKDLILPAGNQEKKEGATDDDFEKLDEESQHQLIVQAIEVNDEKWRTTLPNIQSIGSGKKYIKDKKTALNAIVFEVKKKELNIDDEDKVPTEIEFQGYRIPTDVQERSSLVTTQARRGPGSSVSRIELDDGGTIGLKVFKKIDDKVQPFLLSCYHVLCLSELRDKILRVEKGVTTSDPKVVSPARRKDDKDVSHNIVGTVEEGTLNTFLDAAIARLTSEHAIELTVGGKLPSQIYDLKKSDEDSSFVVQSWGAASAQPSPFKKVLKISDNPSIIYDGIGSKVMKHLIQTEKISQSGDSGAPVFTMDGKVVGIIVGGDEVSVSYILPIRRILNTLSVRLTTS